MFPCLRGRRDRAMQCWNGVRCRASPTGHDGSVIQPRTYKGVECSYDVGLRLSC